MAVGRRSGVGSSIALALMIASAGAAPAESPMVGDPAPAFSLVGSDGSTHSLAAQRGKRAVVLAFFPKAFTPG